MNNGNNNSPTVTDLIHAIAEVDNVPIIYYFLAKNPSFIYQNMPVVASTTSATV